MRLPDYVTGLFLTGLGGLCYYGGSLLPPVPGQQVGPNVFPMVVGGGLVLCGVMIALNIGRKFEDEAEADLAAIEGGAAAPEETRPLYRLRVLLPPALLLFYVFAVERIGFIPTAAHSDFPVVAGARRAAETRHSARDPRARSSCIFSSTSSCACRCRAGLDTDAVVT